MNRIARRALQGIPTTGLVTGLLLYSAGCGSGNSSSSPSPTPTPTPTPTVTSVYVIQNSPTSTTSTSAILQFDSTDSGTATPISTISAPEHNSVFGGLAVDGSGNIYTTHEILGGGSADLREYAAGVTGTAGTLRSLPQNSTTQIGAVDGIGTSSSGEIFVAEDSGGIAAFSATATGSIAPSRYILGYSQTGGGLSTVVVADAIAADASDNLYVLNEGAPGLSPIVVFGPTATGNVAPLRSLGGAATQINSVGGLTLDSAGNLYMTSNTVALTGTTPTYTGSILVFAPGASGNVAPSRIITGAATTLDHLWGIKLDGAGNIYVVSTSATGTSPAVLKFAAAASGNVAPTSSFTSTAWTAIDNGGSIAVH